MIIKIITAGNVRYEVDAYEYTVWSTYIEVKDAEKTYIFPFARIDALEIDEN